MTAFATFDLPDRTYRTAAWVIIGVAALLRFWDLGGPSLWFDEAVYAMNSRGSFADVVAATQTNNSSPLLLPILLNLIERTVGLNEITARLPSALFGIAAVAVMTRLSDVGVKRPVALVSAALLAAAQMQIIYSQEVREYGLSILMSAILLWSFFRMLSSGRAMALAATLMIVPWVSYGPCFAALAILSGLTFLRLMGRTQVAYSKLGLCAGAFIASAAASYFAVAQFQLGTAKQWYLIEHYYQSSGLGLVEWLVTNSGGILLASLPGLLAVIILPLIMLAFLCRYLKRPLALLDEPAVVVAVVLIGGMILAGLLELYPYGSPRHSVFVGPFLCLMFATGVVAVLAALPERRRRPGAAVLFASLACSTLLTIFAVPIGAGLHPALAKVGKVEIYGEYEDNRALMAFAREQTGKSLFGTPGASPAARYYGSDLVMTIPKRDLIGNSDAQAAEILAQARSRPVAVVMSNMLENEGSALRAAVEARGGVVTDIFIAKRVEGFVVTAAAEPQPANP